MGKNKLFTAITLIAFFTTNFSFSQISGTLTPLGNGSIDYDFQTPNNNDLVFVIYGDGAFGYGHQTVHQFANSQTGYTSIAYSAKKDDTNVPDRMVVNTDPINNAPANIINPAVWMPGPIDIKTSWAPASGYENYFIVSFRNETSGMIPSGRIQLNYNQADVQIDPADVLVYNNTSNTYVTPSGNLSYTHALMWDFSNLHPSKTIHIYVPGFVTQSSGTILNMSATMTSTSGLIDAASVEPIYMVRRYPHDPNFKIVDKKCLAYGLTEGQKLNYTIGFYNEGTYFATDVTIVDELSPSLVGSSVNVTGYEHQPLWEVNQQNFEMVFVGIMLPGINQSNGQTFYSYSDASSFVSFSACTSDNLFQIDGGNCLLNSASIVFDNLPEILTDTAIVCLEESCFGYDVDCPTEDGFKNDLNNHFTVSNTNGSSILTISPNPASTDIIVTINFGEVPQDGFSLDVIDMDGKPVKNLVSHNEPCSFFKQQFYLGDLTNGVYVIVLSTGESFFFEKLIKQ